MAGCVCQRQLGGAAALCLRWAEESCSNTAPMAVSRRMPVGSPLSSRSILPPCGSGVCAVMPAAFKCGAVGDGNVPVDAIEDCRMIAGDGVNVRARRRFLLPPTACGPSHGLVSIRLGLAVLTRAAMRCFMSSSDLLPIRLTFSFSNPPEPRCT